MTNFKTYALPIAIVIAGALIAGTIYGTQGNAGLSTSKVKSVGDILNETMQPEVQVDAITDADHILGPKNAKIKLIVYTDPECPYCKMYHNTLNDLVKAHKNAGDVAVVYRLFPLDRLHPKAPKESEAFECAREVGGTDAFWKYADALFAATPSNNQLDLAKLYEFANQINLDPKLFKTCLDSGKYASKVAASADSGYRAGGVGTPYTIILINGEFIPLVDNNGDGIGAIPLAPLEKVLTGLAKNS